MRFCPPRILPKMDFRKTGIPDACRTLVVVPMMLTSRATIADEAEKLEIDLVRRPAGTDDHLANGPFPPQHLKQPGMEWFGFPVRRGAAGAGPQPDLQHALDPVLDMDRPR